MSPKQVLQQWLQAFNEADVEKLAKLYSETAVNHQVVNEPVEGRAAIRKMFETEFASAEMVCIPQNIFEVGEWAILVLIDPFGMRGCGFFQVHNDQIIFHRGDWDRISFHKLHNIPLQI